jgi:hypothetical protein
VSRKAPTLEQIDELLRQKLSWPEISARLGYQYHDAARKRYAYLNQVQQTEGGQQAKAAYAYLRERNPCEVTWHELHKATGIPRNRALAILGYTRSQWRTANRDDEPPPAPVWRDMGKGAQVEYDRAAARVERMVAAGDDRSAAINQVAQEMGVKVR